MWLEGFSLQIWSRAAGGGRQWPQRWEWLSNNFSPNHMPSPRHSHTAHYCCSLTPVPTAAVAQKWLATQWDHLQNGFCHTEPTLNKLPYHVPYRAILWLNCHFIVSFQSLSLVFFSATASRVVELLEWCVYVLMLLWAPGLFLWTARASTSGP